MAPTTKGADTKHDLPGMLRWVVALVAAAAVAGFFGRDFLPLEFEPNAGEIALSVLGTLFIVALFVERAQQVYIYVWRGMARRKLDSLLAGAEKQLQDAEAAVAAAPDAQKKQEHEDRLPALRTAEFDARITIDDFRAETRKIALFSGMVLGIAIAFAGPRLLESIVMPIGDAGDLGGFHDWLFTAIDILITGGLIGGGSEGIHKLISLVTDFLDQSRDRVRGARPDAAAGQGS